MRYGLLFFVVLALGCTARSARPTAVGAPRPAEPTSGPRSAPERLAPTAPPELPAETRAALIEAGQQRIGQGLRPFSVDESRFTADCIGFVEAVYHSEGIPFRDVMSMAPEDEGSGVRAAYRAVKQYGVVFTSELTPQPGDLIFWDNTYDSDRDGRYDDPLTHVGMVEELLPDGTVKFLHRGGKGVTHGYMNLARRDEARSAEGGVLNSSIRYKQRRDPEYVQYLAGQLFVSYGRFDPLRLGAALEGKKGLRRAALGLEGAAGQPPAVTPDRKSVV